MSGNWWALITAAEVAWVIGMVVWILFERRPPAATVAWIIALAALPVIGVLVYFLAGPRRFDRKKMHRAFARAAAREAAVLGSRKEARALGVPANFATLGITASGESGRPREARLELFFEGRTLYASLLEAVAAAEHHIHLEYYIWEPDNIGTRLRDALIERARAGVEVRVLVDGFGAAACKRKFWRPLRQAGGVVHRFNIVTLWRLRRRLANFRTHRKIVVVDGRIGFTGGMNVTDVHTAEFSGPAAWRDTHARIEGEAVQGLQLVFCESWHDACGEVLDAGEYFPGVPDAAGDRAVQVMASGPDENYDVIHKLFVGGIASARSRVLLTVPYFVPDEALFVALSTAALSGVDVRVLVPAKNDLRLVGAASRSYYPELIAHGVKIYEYGPPMLHAKSMVVDEMLAVVGTANADVRSFRLNFEVLLACYDRQTCEELAAAFAADLESAREITEDIVAGYGFPQRLFQNFARLLSPTL